MTDPKSNLKGQRFPKPKGPASLILEPMRDWIWTTLNCFWNPTITAKYLGSDGVSTITKDAEIIMGPLGWTAMVDLSEFFAGGGTASIQQFKIDSDGGDYWNCYTWDGTTLGGTIIKVAKPYKIRCVNGPASEVIRGGTYNYAYSSITVSGQTFYKRVTSGATTQTDYIESDPLNGDIIYAASFSTLAPSTLVGVVWVDLNVDGRAWTQQ